MSDGYILVPEHMRDWFLRLIKIEREREEAATRAWLEGAGPGEVRTCFGITSAQTAEAIMRAPMIQLPVEYEFSTEEGRDRCRVVAWSEAEALEVVKADGRFRPPYVRTSTCLAYPGGGAIRVTCYREEQCFEQAEELSSLRGDPEPKITPGDPNTDPFAEA